MNSSDYLDGSSEYESLYPQTVMDSDSQDSHEHGKHVPLSMIGHGKHFECFCGKIFISKADYNRHMLVHTGERPHECDICGKAFSLKGNLTKHMLLHTEEKSYHCPECGKSFLKKGYIDQHMRVHTGEKPFLCTHCNRAFSLKGNLAQHMKLHTDEKSYHCLECNKLFLKKSYLVQHMRVHAGDKPHRCNLCNRAFNLKGNLAQHMKRHSGRKPFKCDECGKSFALKGALKEHEKVHGGDKPFICTVCSKAFNKKAYLTQHERTHTGERPFRCVECDKSFSQRSILNQHMRQHGERSYKCCQCHKIFLKKLTALPKNKTLRFGGYKCSSCDARPQNEVPSDDSDPQVYFKEEQPLANYDSESYVRDDNNISLYNLDSTQKSEKFSNKLTMGNMPQEQNIGTLLSETNGVSERVYEFNSQSIQPSVPTDNADARKCTEYNHKKVAYAHAISKENGKRFTDNQNKTNSGIPSLNKVEEVPDHSKKVDVTYTELKVAKKKKHSDSGHKQMVDRGNTSSLSGIVVRESFPYTPVEISGTQKHSSSGKSSSIDQVRDGNLKYCGMESAKGTGVQMLSEHSQKETFHKRQALDNTDIKKSTDKNPRKSTPDESNSHKAEDNSSKRNTPNERSSEYAETTSNRSTSSERPFEYSDSTPNRSTPSERSLEYAYRRHPALVGIDPQVSINFSQRSGVDNSSSAEENEAKRSLLYSQSSLADYNARNMDLRYIESLREPFQRGFPGIRQGNIPEMESALSRFGIKGYYNTPWSFAGNYPE